MAALAPRKLCRLCKSMEVVEGRGAARYGTLLSGTSPSRARSGRPYGTARGTMVGWNTRSPLSRDPGAAGPSSSTVWSHARGPAAPSTFRSFTPLSSSTLRRHRPSPSSETTGTSRRSYATAAADYYKVLKVPHGATRQQIKAKFYELSKRFHPDAPGGNTTKFHEIGEAYEVLGDDLKRREYDQTLAGPNPRYTSYQNPASSYAPYATNSRRTAGPHAAWSTRPPPPPGGPRGHPFSSPSPDAGQYGGPLFGQGYQPFRKYDGRQSTSGDYGEPLFVFRFNLKNDPNSRQGKKELDDMQRLFAAAFRDPFHPKHQEMRNTAFTQAKRGQSGPSQELPLGPGFLTWAMLIGGAVLIWKGTAGADERGEK